MTTNISINKNNFHKIENISFKCYDINLKRTKNNKVF